MRNSKLRSIASIQTGLLFVLCVSTAWGGPESTSIAINFAADAAPGNVVGDAGVLRTQIWNNVPGAVGSIANIIADDSGARSPTGIGLDWSAAGVARSTTVDVPRSPNDTNLMTGHLIAPSDIRFNGLDERFPHGYDVYLYTFGGRAGDRHDYQLTTDNEKFSQINITQRSFAGDYVEGQDGNYLAFRNIVSDNLFIEAGGSLTAIEIDGASYDCLKGDFNEDGDVDAEDIDMLTSQIKSGRFNECFDLNRDGVLDAIDCETWVTDVKKICAGDANMDGEFNSGDLVSVFQKGEYEDDIECNSGWADGDWNCDGEFGSEDFVFAFQQGWYEKGPLAIAANDGFRVLGAPPVANDSFAAVPEPSTSGLLVASVFGLIGLRCRKR
jgi:hypothetical protein